MAAQRFEESAQSITDIKTIKALHLLARNYSQRADQIRTLFGETEAPTESKQLHGLHVTLSHSNDETKTSADFEQHSTKIADCHVSEDNPALPEGDAVRTENELNLAAMEIEELWIKLNAIGLSNSLRAEKASTLY